MEKLKENINFFFKIYLSFFCLLGCNSSVIVSDMGSQSVKDENSRESEENSTSNIYSISDLDVSIEAHDTLGFDIEVEGQDGTLKAFYCNSTDTPACIPELDGTEIEIVQTESGYSALPPKLGVSDDIADTLKISVLVIHNNQTQGKETLTYTIPAIVKIFRSVGPGSTTSLASSGGATLNITDSIAEFGVALADTIGVGDIIQYDTDNDNVVDSVIAIHGRLNSNFYLVKNIDGSAVSDLAIPDQDWEIFRAYTSIRDAESAIENTGIDDTLENFDSWSGGRDLVTNTEQWNITLYADAEDTGGELEIIGWTTDDDHYLHIYTPTKKSEVGVSQRHQGLLNGPGFVFRDWIRFQDNKTIIEGVIVKYSGTRGLAVVFRPITDPAKAYFIGNIVYTDSANTGWGPVGTFAGGGADQEFYIINNIIIPAQPGSAYAGIYTTHSSGPQTYKVFAYNNTIYCTHDNGAHGILRDSGSLYLKNNLVDCSNSSSNDFGDDGGTGSIVDAYNNISTDDTADDFGSANNSGNIVNQTYVFLDAGNFNFEQTSMDTTGKGQALNLANDSEFPFSLDILGESRNHWDIGAYAYE